MNIVQFVPSSHAQPSVYDIPSTSGTNTLSTLANIDSTGGSGKVKKLKNVRKSNCFKCVVCSDKPTGYHYDVLSCNGCKTFFRRTVISGRSFSCTKGGQCEFSKDFRCSCRACRFQKCVQAGMNAESIQWPTMTQRESISEEEQKSADNQNSHCHSPIVQEIPQAIVMFDVVRQKGIVEYLMAKEQKFTMIRERYTLFTSHSLTEVLNMPSVLGSTKLPDRLKLRDAHTQHLYSLNPVKFWMISDHHLIAEYAKTFAAYRSLSIKDQAALLAHIGGLQLLLIQAFSSFRKGHCTTVFPDGIVALESMEDDKCCTALRKSNTPWLSEIFSEPVETLKDIGLTDETYVLLRAVALFSPVDNYISDEGRKIISVEREKLMDGLTKQLFIEHGHKAIHKMVMIQSILQKMIRLNERRRSQFLYLEMMGTLRLSPIGREIYLRKTPSISRVLSQLQQNCNNTTQAQSQHYSILLREPNCFVK